jgi:type II secretory pathway pseudopilin PulG
LIELLLVTGIILIIAVITVPNLSRAKIAANEASAVQTVRQISTAQTSYHASYAQVGYAPTVATLGGPATGCVPSPANACIIDSVITTGYRTA